MNGQQAQEYWDSRFEGDQYRFGETPNAFLVRQLPRLAAGQNALVIADGEGRNGVWLARQGLTVTTTDVSPRAIAKARALAERHGVEIDARQVDLESWNWPEAAFDVVVAIFIQFAEPDARERMFTAMKRALKPGGLLLLHGYRPEQLTYGTGGPPEAKYLYTEALLRGAFADFEMLDIRSYDVEIQEGVGHAGMSALIDLVARRPL